MHGEEDEEYIRLRLYKQYLFIGFFSCDNIKYHHTYPLITFWHIKEDFNPVCVDSKFRLLQWHAHW